MRTCGATVSATRQNARRFVSGGNPGPVYVPPGIASAAVIFLSASRRLMSSAQFIAGLVFFVSGTTAPGMSWRALERIAVVTGVKAIGIANIATNTTTKKATLLGIA